MSKNAEIEKHRYGQGSFWYNNSKKKWYARVRAGKKADGTPFTITVCADTKEECELRLEEAKKEKAFFYFVDPETVTVREMLIEVLNQKLKNKELEKSTYTVKMHELGSYDFLLDMRVKDVTTNDVETFFQNSLDSSNGTIRSRKYYLNKVFDISIALGIVDDSPLRGIPNPSSKRKPNEIRAMTVDEQKDFTRLMLQNREHYAYWSIIMISLYTGMSVGEIVALNAEDIDLENGYVTVNKKVIDLGNKRELTYDIPNREKRKVPINIIIRPVFVMLLKEHKRVPGSPIYRNRNRQYPQTSVIANNFRRFMQKYEIKDPTVQGILALKSLKKTFAARCLEAGVQSKVVQKQITIATNYTMRTEYPETTLDDRIAAAEGTNDYLRSVGIK